MAERSNAGQCLNLVAQLESSKPLGRLFLPTAEEVNFETPAVDLLSSFIDRSNNPPPPPNTPRLCQGLHPVDRKPIKSVFSRTAEAVKLELSPNNSAPSIPPFRLDAEDLLASLKALSLNKIQVFQYRRPHPTQGHDFLSRKHTGSVVFQADQVNQDNPWAASRRRAADDDDKDEGKKRGRGPAKKAKN